MRVLIAVLVGVVAGMVSMAPVAAAEPPAPVDQCTVTDERLAELSGLVADGDRWYAVADGGAAASVVVLTKDCAVERMITGQTDPFDVEDLARSTDGTFWLSDTGDNEKKRDTVALISLTPDGQSALYRLTYPDGAHDTEALVLDAAGTPYLVTKSPLGGAEVYTPAAALTSPGPTALTRVASVRINPTDTPGGPVPGVVGSVVVTGGATSVDGGVVALRTYTDAYLFAVRNGDIPAALETEPVRVPLPDEAQGEAIAFDQDGALLSASESRDGVTPPIRMVPNATALVAPQPDQQKKAPENTKKTEEGGQDGLPALPGAAVTIAFLGTVLLLFRWLRNRRRR